MLWLVVLLQWSNSHELFPYNRRRHVIIVCLLDLWSRKFARVARREKQKWNGHVNLWDSGLVQWTLPALFWNCRNLYFFSLKKWVFCLHVYLYTTCVPSVPRDRNRGVLYLLGLELQTVMSCHLVLGTEPGPLEEGLILFTTQPSLQPLCGKVLIRFYTTHCN